MGLLPEKLAIGVDAAGIGDIVDELTTPERGITAEQIIAISQGWKLNGAIKTTERKIAGGQMVHCGSALMAWCVSNARVVAVGNAITITKQVSGSAKIDPLMSTFDAVSLIALNPVAGTNKIQQGFVEL
jgi:phage terminase large subunit-like protein